MNLKRLLSKETIYFLMVVCVLVCVRAVYYKQTHFSPGLRILSYTGDQGFYRQSAKRFASGNWIIKKGDISRGPGYIYFLGLIYKLSGNSYTVVRFIQHFLGILSGIFIFLLGKRLFNRKTAFVAVFLYAFYFPAVCFEGTFLMASFLTFLLTLGLWCFIKAFQDGIKKFYFLSGLVYGWAFLCRPNNILLPIFLVIYLVVKRVNIKSICCFLTGLFLLFSLLTVRNYFAGGELFNVSTQAEYVILSSHYHDADGITWQRPDFEKIQKIAEESKENKFAFTNFIISDIYWHFPRWIKLQFFKLYAYFFGFEFSQFIKFSILKENIPLLNAPYIPFGVLSSLGLLGLFMVFRNRRSNKIIVGYFFVMVFGTVIFYIASRFRQPAVPLFCLFGGYAISGLPGYFRSLGLKGRIGLLVVFFAILMSLNWVPKKEAFRREFDKDYLFHHHNMDLFSEPGVIDQLTAFFKQDPTSSKLAMYIGFAYFKQKDLKNAIHWLERAMVMGGRSILSASILGQSYVLAGECNNKTVRLLKSVLKDEPGNIEAGNALAYCYLNLGQDRKAIEIWRKNTKLFPYDFVAYYGLGIYYEKRGDFKRAYEKLEKALRIAPKSKSILCAVERVESKIRKPNK